MSLVDSEASFKSRCIAVGGNEDLWNSLKRHNIKTFADLSFACGTPQAPPSDDAFRLFSEDIFGAGPTLGQTSKLRRLHFEAGAVIVAHLRQQVTGDSAEAPKRLPMAEKEARYLDIKTRLPGLVLEDELLPSHELVDAVAHMVEANHLTWFAPSRCTKREQELRIGVKQKDRVLSVLDNAVTLTTLPDKLTADHSSPLHLQWCLQRRGLALDMCRVLSWRTHEKWLAFLLQALTREVPPGYAPMSINQLLRADSEMFLLISKQVTSLKPDSSGTMQVDQAMSQLGTDSRVTMRLLPLPKSAAQASAPAENDTPPEASWKQRSNHPLVAEVCVLVPIVVSQVTAPEVKARDPKARRQASPKSDGMKIWGEKICDSFSVIYLDNEAAKGALLKGSSSTIQGNLLVDSILEMEEAFRTRAWFAR
ncbi:unnamed protein product, partial [Symbiodinium pilosum]